MTHSHITDHAKKKAWKVSNTFSSGPVRFNTVKISQNLPYSLTENDQYKHLPNVSEMITVIILALTRQMSILNGVAHQLLWGMDVMIQQYKTEVDCSGAKRQFNESKKKNEINQGSRLK